MGTITFVEHDGTEHSADLEVGKSLMQMALDHGIPSIDADCGGECACGTCHVILDTKWIAQVGTASASELQMLDLTPKKQLLHVWHAKFKYLKTWMVCVCSYQNIKCNSQGSFK